MVLASGSMIVLIDVESVAEQLCQTSNPGTPRGCKYIIFISFFKTIGIWRAFKNTAAETIPALIKGSDGDIDNFKQAFLKGHERTISILEVVNFRWF